MQSRKTNPVVALLGALMLAAGAEAAGPATTANDDSPTFVEPPQRPTEVTIAAYLIGLSRLSEPSESFPTWEAEVFLDMSWRDPQLAFEGERPHVFQGGEAEQKLSEIWSPYPEIQNEVEQRQTESIELILFPDGRVQYEERFGATLNAELDLARFPFDTQTLELELQSFLWDLGDSVFVLNEEQIGFDPDFNTPEWTVTGAEAHLGVRSEIRDVRAFSTFIFRIHAERNSGHYVLRFILPLLFVMGLTWAALWMPAGPRVRVGFVALLTVVASHTVISDELPRLHYLTFADVLLYICYIYATALIVVSIRVQQLEERDLNERATLLDRRIRWILPALTILAVACSILLLWR